MVLAIPLSPELERRLHEAACRHGMTVEDFTLDLLERQVRTTNRAPEAAALLQNWLNEPPIRDEENSGESFLQAIDADRMSDRPLYPPELKGVTW